ncbi:hypothetical protein ACWEQ0_28615 [Nocardia thailandica]
MDPLTELISAKMTEAGLSPEAMTVACYGNPDLKGRVKRRLGGGLLNETDLAFFHTAVRLLQIGPDELLRALLPDVPTANSLVIANKELKMKLNAIQEHLATDPGDSGIGVVRDITASGRWAAGVMPFMSGPTDTTQVLTTTRVAVALARPELRDEDKTVREMFIDDFGAILGDRALFTGPAVQPLAQPPVPVDAEDVVHLMIPSFARDRGPSPAPVDLPRIGPGVVVTATLQASQCANIAALAGRSIGWGVENASSVRRIASPILDGDRDVFVARMNKLRNDGLRSKLLTPPRSTVVHHTGHAVVDDEGVKTEGHPVVDLLSNDYDLPFLVVLRESDEMIDRQNHTALRFSDRTPRWPTETWANWRDELVTAVEPLVRQRRAMVVDLEYAWPVGGRPDDPYLSSRLLWQRNTKSAVKIVKRLLDWGGSGIKLPPTNLDPEAESLLRTEWQF